MRKEVRNKVINYDVYISEDGEEFDNEKDAIHHDRLINGEIRECIDCNGTGFITKTEEFHNYYTNNIENFIIRHYCHTCKGKGYLERWE